MPDRNAARSVRQERAAVPFEVITGTGDCPSVDDRTYILCELGVPDAYPFDPTGYYWRKEIRASESAPEIHRLISRLRGEVAGHRKDMLERGIACMHPECPPNSGNLTTNALAWVSLLERHKRTIVEAGLIPGMNHVTIAELDAKPHLRRACKR